MEMANDVFPRRNLPDEAEMWGREHDKRVVAIEDQIIAVKQSLTGQNRNTASSLSVLGNQITAIEQAQADLATQQATLASQQAAIISTQNFLSTQTLSDSKSTLDQYTGAAGTVTWFNYNPTYDCALTVTTGAAGKLLIQGSATLLSSGLTAILGIEISGIVAPTYPGPFSTYMSATSASSSGVSRSVVATLSANTAYTVILRRGAAGASGTAMWRDQTLVVTRS